MAALLSLLRRPRPERGAPATSPAPRPSRSGTYAATRPREPDAELDAALEEFVHLCRGDEERFAASPYDEPAMVRNEHGDRLSIPDV